MDGKRQILEETGKTLTASPLVSTVLLGATAINLGGNVLQKETWLPQIAAGELVIGFALEEGKHHSPNQLSTVVKATADGGNIELVRNDAQISFTFTNGKNTTPTTIY